MKMLAIPRAKHRIMHSTPVLHQLVVMFRTVKWCILDALDQAAIAAFSDVARGHVGNKRVWKGVTNHCP